MKLLVLTLLSMEMISIPEQPIFLASWIVGSLDLLRKTPAALITVAEIDPEIKFNTKFYYDLGRPSFIQECVILH